MSPKGTYSCQRLYHLFDTDKTRDIHYKETTGRWNQCTHPRCPLRYNTDQIPPHITIPKSAVRAERTQERKITQVYQTGPAIESSPAPAGTRATASPRISSGSFLSPQVQLTSLPSPLATTSSLRAESESETPSPSGQVEPERAETPRTDSEKSETESIQPERRKTPESEVLPYASLPHSEHNTPPETPVRKAIPSFMSNTATISPGTSISTAHGYAFQPGQHASGSGGYMGGSGSMGQPVTGTVPVATATSGGAVGQTSGGGSSSATGGTGGGGGGGGSNPNPNPGGSGGGGGGGGGGGPNPNPGPNPPNPNPGPGNPQGQPIPPVIPHGKGKIKDPEVFNGDRSKTRSFLNQLFLLFTARAHDFPDDTTKVATALSFMEGENINYWKDTAIRRAEEEVQPGIPRGFDTWAVFKQNFQASFAPVDEVDDSMVNITTIQLKDYASVDEFNARFMDLALKGNILDPTAQLALYRQALPEYLLRKIAVSYPAPTTIAEWMTRTKELDHSYQLTEKILANRKTHRAKNPRTKKTVRAVNVEQNPSLGINKLSVKERQELQSKGLCFRCRKPGHISRDCPSEPKQTRRPVNRKVRQVAQESSDDSEEEQEDDDEEELQVNALRATDFNSDF